MRDTWSARGCKPAKPKSDNTFKAAMDILEDKVPKMVERGLTRAKCHCKSCGGKNTVIIVRDPKPGRRGQVVRWSCKAEGCGFMGMT